MSVQQLTDQVSQYINCNLIVISTHTSQSTNAIWDMLVHKVILYGVMDLLIAAILLGLAFIFARFLINDDLEFSDFDVFLFFCVSIASCIGLSLFFRGFFLIFNAQYEAIFQLDTLVETIKVLK